MAALPLFGSAQASRKRAFHLLLPDADPAELLESARRAARRVTGFVWPRRTCRVPRWPRLRSASCAYDLTLARAHEPTNARAH